MKLFTRTLATTMAWLLLLGSSDVLAQSNVEQPKTFVIGNSLSWDALPGLLDGDVQWHIDCGKSLKYIYEHPAAPCVKNSVSWPQALSEKQYDFLCVQPYSGTSLSDDIEIIGRWMNLQPASVLVVHTGWGRREDFEKLVHQTEVGDEMLHSEVYFDKLIAALQEKFPNRTIRSTHALRLLDFVWHDIHAGKAPFAKFEELYRDSVHMNMDTGRYLSHNALRVALGQPISGQGFQVPAKHRNYLDGILGQLQMIDDEKPVRGESNP